MPTGTVKWFNTTKGYGFIAPEGGGSDVFVHISAVERSGLTGLADEQKVSFEMSEGRDGRQMIQRHVVLGTSLAQGAGYAGAFQGMYDHLLCDDVRRRDPFIALTLSAQRRVLR
mgnify:CR=1 FL=1